MSTTHLSYLDTFSALSGVDSVYGLIYKLRSALCSGGTLYNSIRFVCNNSQLL